MRYLSHTESDIRHMLQCIGRPDLDSLFQSIPKVDRLVGALDLPAPMSEIELKRHMTHLGGEGVSQSFLSGGLIGHHIPELVSQMLLRGEWLTAYTPYQPEISQGTLQAIFEFQTMVASLLGQEVANASMYDGATAFCEGALMAVRIKRVPRILISQTVHPEYREVCQNLLSAAQIEAVHIPMSPNGQTDYVALEQMVRAEPVSAVLFQTPNFFGQLEDISRIVALCKETNTLSVAATCEPVAFGVMRSLGSWGVDIVAGEGGGLCAGLNLGGPGVGLFACSTQHVRQMPGRLAGETVDAQGERGFVLTLSTREQHIRRERATSNICTNHALMALAFAITLSLYGKKGFRTLAEINLKKTLYLRKKCVEAGIRIAFDGPHFNETVLDLQSDAHLEHKLAQLAARDVHAGLRLSRWYPNLPGHLLLATTELHTDRAIDALVEELRA